MFFLLNVFLISFLPCEQVGEKLGKAARTEDRVWENASVREVCARIVHFLERDAVDKAHSLLLRYSPPIPRSEGASSDDFFGGWTRSHPLSNAPDFK